MPCLGFKTKLHTNNKQSGLLTHWSNVRRYAYNYALGLTYLEQDTLPEGEKWKLSRINEYDKMFNQGKIELLKERKGKGGSILGSGQHTWCSGVPCSVSQQAIKYDLKSAWQRCFKKLGKRPRFQSKYKTKSFTLSNGDFKLKNVIDNGKYIEHRKLGKCKLGDGIPKEYITSGKLMNTSFTCSGGVWYVSFTFELPDEVYYKISNNRHGVTGVDLGVSSYATLYNKTTDESEHIDFPVENLANIEDKIRRNQRKQSKCVKGSNGYKMLAKRINKLKHKQSNIRNDNAHKLSKRLATENNKIVMEKLDLKNMTKSKGGNGSKFNGSVLNMGLYKLIESTRYKSDIYGSEFVLVNPAYTSQTCNSCGHVDKQNRKTQSEFKCVSCGHSDNADINAARNILDKSFDTEAVI